MSRGRGAAAPRIDHEMAMRVTFMLIIVPGVRDHLCQLRHGLPLRERCACRTQHSN